MNKSIPLFLLLVLVSCGPGKPEQAADKSEQLIVSAVNYPLFYFAQRIGAELIQTEFPAPGNMDPAYWIPDDEALSIYQSSGLILANGANYAKWMEHVSLPSSRIINTSSGAKDSYVEIIEGDSHSHGPDGEHVHTGYAFTTWLDFQIAITQAKAVMEILLSSLPDKRNEIEGRYRELEKELLDLHAAMMDIADSLEKRNLIGSHPVYQYLAEAYSLNISSVHFEPGEMPSESQWKEFDGLIGQHPSTIMLWEDEPLPEVKDILLEKGILALVFNPCGNRPVTGDFMQQMRNNIQALQKALEN
jgi:zinc transport system substrate-binding protein